MKDNLIARLLRETGRIVYFAWVLAKNLFSFPPNPRYVLEQMYVVGVRSVPVLLPVSIFLGSNVALLGYKVFRPLGGESLLGIFVGLAGIRELAPIVAATLMAAKIGTEIATTLAAMRMSEQIDALEVMGVSPFWYLISPRLVAVGVMLPVLIVIADFFCFYSGYVVSTYQLGVDSGGFLLNGYQYVGGIDILVGIFKGGLFGVCITTISCYYGFFATGGAEGVGLAANRSVVVSAVVVALLNYFLSAVLYV